MARDLVYEPDLLFLPEELLEKIRDEIPTPCYVYDAAGIRAEAEKIRAGFAWNTGNRQFFPVKALRTPAILRLMMDCGYGLLCTTAVELELAVRLGAKCEQMLYAPVFPSEEELARALELRVPLVVDSEAVLHTCIRLGQLPERVLLRFHPRKPVQVGVRILVRPESVKFGMDEEELLSAARLLWSKGVRKIGLHCHLCSYLTEPGYWQEIAGLLAACAAKLKEKVGLKIDCLDIGGGLAVDGIPEKRNLPDIADVAGQVHSRMEKLGLLKMPVYTEFGRALTGPHGLLLTRVREVKQIRDPRPVIGMDASGANLMRMLAFRAHHHVSVAGKTGTAGRQFYTIAGTMAERADRFYEPRLLPEVEPGDLLAVHGCGAYCSSMQMPNGMLRPAEYLLQDGALRLIRPAQTVEEYLSNFDFSL